MDSATKIVSCMQKAAQQENIGVPSADEVKSIIGISLIPAIKQLFGVNEEWAHRLAESYKTQFIRHDQTPAPLFSGVKTLLNELSEADSTLAVATGKARVGLQRAFAQTNTEHFFDLSRCADEAKSKPHPDMLLQLLEETGCTCGEALMIGDTSHDMAMAESINMDRIAVSYGAHGLEQLKKHTPTEIVHSVTELHTLLV